MEDDKFKIDEDQYKLDEFEDPEKPRPTSELEETEAVPIDDRKETIHFPWGIAIVIGVLMTLIIACFIVIMILGPEDPVTSSSEIISSSL